MTKRIAFMVVGAGLGSLLGIFAAFLGAGMAAIPVCAALGALAPLLFGAPGK